MEVVLYKFNNTNQDTEVIKCSMEKAKDLYKKELDQMDQGKSKYNYLDITLDGKMIRSSRQ